MASLNISRTRGASLAKPQLPPQGGLAPQRFEPSNSQRTHEGAPAAWISPELMLRRSVCSCLLWEDEFYEDGKTIAARISELVSQCPPKVVADLARDARTHLHLRHVPLLLTASLAVKGTRAAGMIGDAITDVIQRADELSEFVAVYMKVHGISREELPRRMSAQVKKGLARAFAKFDDHQLAKYFSQSGEKEAAIRGRDVMFLAHPRPVGKEREDLYRRIASKEAIVEGGADTWEVALSSGADKRETFERLLKDGNLGYMALLRNLRNMVNAKVDLDLVKDAILARKGARRVLPFRYVSAARACPAMAPYLDRALAEAIADMPGLPGKTVILVDVSGSMNGKLSGKSDLTRMDAAATLAMIIPGDAEVYSFSNHTVHVPMTERGLAGVDKIRRSQMNGGTMLGAAVRDVSRTPMDRLIVLTDEQAHDHVSAPAGVKAYMINVASARNGVGYGEWVHLDGFSEQTLRWIREFENL